MRNALLIILALGSTWPLTAGDLKKEERKFFDKHLSDLVALEPTALDDAAVVKVFRTPSYRVKLLIKSPDGAQTQDLIVYRLDDKLTNTSTAHSDRDLPELMKIFRKDFKLKDAESAKTLQQALDLVDPISTEDDKKVATVTHSGNQWVLVRGKLFDDKMGYVFTTDAEGVIQSAKYVMKLQGI